MIQTRCSQRVKKQKKSKTINRYWHYYRLRLLRLKEHPHKLARGFAAGVFAGCFPFIGLQFVMAIIFALIIRGNKFTAILGTWISNPFTYVPLFFFNFQVGKLILSFFLSNHDLDFSWDSLIELKDAGTEITVTLLFGSAMVGLCFSSIAYYLVINILKSKNSTTN
ncbi:DUF2062 domain-containing protein [Geminocystis herdmanii]|uniref:DUF2062 domain-containing protein n=1 Tax=Geminocystis herdmanii TaxID=669359 RepID=UPI0003470833|nr:DUF2062 domain-containing protein [Geminocystis herdmanii]